MPRCNFNSPKVRPVTSNRESTQLVGDDHVLAFPILEKNDSMTFQTIDGSLAIVRGHEADSGNFVIAAKSLIRHVLDECLPATRIAIVYRLHANDDGCSLSASGPRTSTGSIGRKADLAQFLKIVDAPAD